MKDTTDSLTRMEIECDHFAKYKFNRENHSLTNEILDQLWAERNSERGITSKDRSGSCKFAALLARSVWRKTGGQ